jgi:hypothetical protein
MRTILSIFRRLQKFYIELRSIYFLILHSESFTQAPACWPPVHTATVVHHREIPNLQQHSAHTRSPSLSRLVYSTGWKIVPLSILTTWCVSVGLSVRKNDPWPARMREGLIVLSCAITLLIMQNAQKTLITIYFNLVIMCSYREN